MERCRSDLESAADGASETIPDVKLAEHEAWGEVYQRVTAVLTLIIVGEVDLCLRPDFLEDPVLKGIVPGKVASNGLLVAGRQADPRRALDVEVSEALSVGNRGCNDRTQRALFVLPVGKLIWKKAVRM